jgi:hypothetical protein
MDYSQENRSRALTGLKNEILFDAKHAKILTEVTSELAALPYNHSSQSNQYFRDLLEQLRHQQPVDIRAIYHRYLEQQTTVMPSFVAKEEHDTRKRLAISSEMQTVLAKLGDILQYDNKGYLVIPGSLLDDQKQEITAKLDALIGEVRTNKELSEQEFSLLHDPEREDLSEVVALNTEAKEAAQIEKNLILIKELFESLPIA